MYIFITRGNALGDSKDVYRRISNQIDLLINQLKDGILARIESKLYLDNIGMIFQNFRVSRDSDGENINANLSILAAVIIKVGKFRPGIRGKLGYGKGVVDIKDMRFSPDPVKMS